MTLVKKDIYLPFMAYDLFFFSFQGMPLIIYSTKTINSEAI